MRIVFKLHSLIFIMFVFAACSHTLDGFKKSPTATQMETIHTIVNGENDLSCHVYLHYQKGLKEAAPLYVYVAGTGIYSTASGTFNGMSEAALLNGRAVLLNIDKPGIEADETMDAKDPGDRFRVNYSKFRRYTLPTYSRCIVQAIEWALKQNTVKKEILLRGHSEGVLVLTHALLKLQDEHLKYIRKFAFSGSPLESWKTIIEGQNKIYFPEGFSGRVTEKFHQAIKSKDDVHLMMVYSLPSHYLEDALKRPTLSQLLPSLFNKVPDAEFLFLHGRKDNNVRVEAVEELARQNTGARFRFQYYDAGHSLNMQAIDDAKKFLDLH